MEHKQVAITGAAGTLGRAFTKLLLSKGIKVVALDHSEWALAQYQDEFPDTTCELGSFAKFDFDKHSIDALLHLAAYKHVGMGEENVEAFVKNNITRTAELLKNAYKWGIPTLYMSTDKAVEPTGVYGATKMIGEALARRYGHAIARCGNLLGSSGSVIPVWERQIQEGLPVTITDERMARYVIEDFEAADQIWHDFIGGKKLIVPKNMRQVRILDLLAEVLSRHGYSSPEEYAPGVQIIGMKPGEKLNEKLYWEGENDGLE